MARYHFNLFDSVAIMDDDGVELASLVDARRQAVRFFGTVLADAGETIFGEEDLRLEVTDNAGLLLFAIHLATVDAPAVRMDRHRAASRH